MSRQKILKVSKIVFKKMDLLVQFFSWLMDLCHQLCPNYWIDILLFTAITKVMQYPVSLWCHVSGLKMVSLMPQTNRIKIDHYGDADAIGEETAAVFKREHYHPLVSLVPLAIQIVILMCFVKVIYGIAEAEKDSAIGLIPIRDGGVAWVMPLLAGSAAWFLGFCQNHINPLQREQTRTQQIVTNGISIAISLFLGMFVSMGVGLYWAASNLFSICVQLACNITIRPKSRVDYTTLRKSQKELQAFEENLKSATKKVSSEDRKREKLDYKRFFNVANKHLVFYAEGGGFYKYFQGVIRWLLEHSNLTIHYVTNDPADGVFEIARESCRIKPYYIGQMKIIPLMMKMDADMVVMTTPDLDTYQIKRSYVKKDVEYVYMDHGTSSVQMVFRKGAFNHFDTVFLAGEFQVAEHRRSEELYGVKAKTLVPVGYAYLGDLMTRYQPTKKSVGVQVLIAPSYQKDNILDSCLNALLDALKGLRDVRIILRPHPQYVRRNPARMQGIVEKHGKNGVVLDTDFSKPPALYESDVVVTDWSSIAYEFSLVTRRPSLLINTPPKVINPDYDRFGMVATDITFRDRIGVSVNLDNVGTVTEIVNDMIANPDKFRAKIDDLLRTEFYDPMQAAEVGGKYILNALISRSNKKAK